MVRMNLRARDARIMCLILFAASSGVMFFARFTRRRRFRAVSVSLPSTHGFDHMVPEQHGQQGT